METSLKFYPPIFPKIITGSFPDKFLTYFLDSALFMFLY